MYFIIRSVGTYFFSAPATHLIYIIKCLPDIVDLIGWFFLDIVVLDGTAVEVDILVW